MNGTGSRASSWLNWAQQPREAGGLGLAPHQAAGVVGNLVKESGNDLPSWGPTGDNGTAWGTAQWRNERLASLKQMFPDSYQTTEAQQAFMRHEMDTTHNGAYQALLAAKTPEEAATAFNRKYEISADNTGGREAAARQLMSQFGGGDASSGEPGALTSDFAPTTSNNQKSSMPTPALSADDTLGQGALNQEDQKGLLGLPAMGDNTYQSLMGIASSLASISNPDQAKALMAQAQLGKKAQGSWSHQVMPNGQLMMSNTNGQTKIIGKPGDYSKDDTFQVIRGVDATTGLPTERVFNKNQGTFLDGQGAGGGSSGSQLPGTIEELKQSNPSLADQVIGVNEGRIPYPNASRLNPQQTALKNAVSQYFPGVDATVFQGRQQFMKNLATDQPSQPGGQFVGLGHTLDMARQLGEKYVGLGNSDWGYGIGHTLNTTKDSLLGDQRMSTDRSAKVGALDENVDRLTSEIGRLFSGNQGGGIHEREMTRDRFGGNKTPTEAAEGLKAVRDMVLSRKDELLSQADRLNIPRDRIPGLDKLDGTLEQLNGHIDTLKGVRKSTAAPTTTAIDHNAIDAELKRRGL